MGDIGVFMIPYYEYIQLFKYDKVNRSLFCNVTNFVVDTSSSSDASSKKTNTGQYSCEKSTHIDSIPM